MDDFRQVKKVCIFVAFLVMGLIFVLDAVIGFAGNDTFEGFKNLGIAVAVEVMGILYVLPGKEDISKR